jgi:hypothetical protein
MLRTMISIEVIERIPGFDQTTTVIIPLKSANDSNPGNIQPGNKLKWTATIDDPSRGQITLVAVNHDEALDPTESDVQIFPDSKYYVVTSARIIVRDIIREMDDYHN